MNIQKNQLEWHAATGMTCLQSRHNETREKRIAANGRQSAAEKEWTCRTTLSTRSSTPTSPPWIRASASSPSPRHPPTCSRRSSTSKAQRLLLFPFKRKGAAPDSVGIMVRHLFSFQPRRFDLAYNGIPMDALRDWRKNRFLSIKGPYRDLISSPAMETGKEAWPSPLPQYEFYNISIICFPAFSGGGGFVATYFL